MRNVPALMTLIFSSFLAACVSAPPPAPASPGPSPARTEGSSQLPLIQEMERLLSSGKAALEANHLSEGIRSFVAVLALGEENPSAQASRLRDEAEAQLVRIGTRLSLEPGELWIGPDGSQVAGSCRSVGKEGALNPAVLLFENWGSGKSPVADASIRFEFVRGGGALTAVVATDVYGRANAILSRLDSPSSDAVVRAVPVFTERGYTYAFHAARRDFSYLPPSNVARVVALERGANGVASNSQTLDYVASVLKSAGLAAAPLEGKLPGGAFDRAYEGDPTAIRALASASGASFIAFVVSDASAPRQTEYGGKKYNIFTSECRTTLRILRDDGTLVFTLPLGNIRGQGGTPQAATADAFAKARSSLASELNKRIEEIRKSVDGQ